MKNILNFLLISSAALSLSACDTVKSQLGMTRRAPDEFAVMRRAPLEIPPDLNQLASNPTNLPAPQPGMSRPQETAPETEAQMAVLGATSGQASSYSVSQGEAALLQKAGAAQIDPNIRATVNREAVTEAKDNRPVVKRLLHLGDDAPAATLVDPKAEAARLKDNRQKGMAVTNGETPTIED